MTLNPETPQRTTPDPATPDPATLWYPIAAVTDLHLRHIFAGQLLGRELAVWRADDGFVNVWENRCLHRGVRLTLGTNDGRELICRYHGWRYANRSAGCTYIPAHPADAPARTICNRTFPAVEHYGLIWSGEDPVGEPPEIAALQSRASRAGPEATDSTGSTDSAGSTGPVGPADSSGSAGSGILVLRGLPVNAPSDLVLERLAGYSFAPNPSAATMASYPADPRQQEPAAMTVEERGHRHLVLRSVQASDTATVACFVQPVDSNRTVIRPLLSPAPAEQALIDVLGYHNALLSDLRDEIEVEARALPAPEPMVASIERLPIRLASLPETPKGGRSAPLRVCVANKHQAAGDVVALELEPVTSPLPTFQPGAHIDVHLPNGLVRQYSLTNGPGELDRYRIGVKREPESRGGSAALHDDVRAGDVLAISAPRNNFPLRRDARRTVLVAGGIGVTPLLSMAQALHHQDLSYELHYFARSDDHVAFVDVLNGLGAHVSLHLGLSAGGTAAALTELLSAATDVFGETAVRDHLYVCGPGPMLDATRSIAAKTGWPTGTVHFEYFANATEIDDSSSFEVDLARSALSLRVSSGQTILSALREIGVDVVSSCEVGACGTCRVAVIDGTPDHNDVYLDDAEKRLGDQMMVCVSRALSERLVLDL